VEDKNVLHKAIITLHERYNKTVMTQQDWFIVGIGGLLFVLVALFSPIGALFLAGLGIVTFLIYKLSHPKS